jgi:hypothetical protein
MFSIERAHKLNKINIDKQPFLPHLDTRNALGFCFTAQNLRVHMQEVGGFP